MEVSSGWGTELLSINPDAAFHAWKYLVGSPFHQAACHFSGGGAGNITLRTAE
jgi:hypothetical protein